jgi:iron complex transport system permease protein
MIKNLTAALLIIILAIAPFIGTVPLNLPNLFTPGTLSHQIFFELRLPRLLMAFMAGATLSLAGLLFQSLFRNVLMTPYTLGVSSGAVLGAGIAIKLGIGTLFFGLAAITFFGFLGALLTVLLLLWLSRFLTHERSNSFLLLGIALSFFYTSALMIVYYLSSVVESHMLIRFTMGSLSVIGYTSALIVTFTTLLLLGVLHVKRYELHLLALSEEQARLKGLDCERLRLRLLIVASLSVGVLVSLTGPIGFIGLVVPHIVRTLYRRNITELIMPAFFMGGLFLVACDVAARLLSVGSEIPIGIITSLIGGPFFIYLIISKR